MGQICDHDTCRVETSVRGTFPLLECGTMVPVSSIDRCCERSTFTHARINNGGNTLDNETRRRTPCFVSYYPAIECQSGLRAEPAFRTHHATVENSGLLRYPPRNPKRVQGERITQGSRFHEIPNERVRRQSQPVHVSSSLTSPSYCGALSSLIPYRDREVTA